MSSEPIVSLKFPALNRPEGRMKIAAASLICWFASHATVASVVPEPGTLWPMTSLPGMAFTPAVLFSCINPTSASVPPE